MKKLVACLAKTNIHENKDDEFQLDAKVFNGKTCRLAKSSIHENKMVLTKKVWNTKSCRLAKSRKHENKIPFLEK